MSFCRFLEVNVWRDLAGTLVATSEASALPASSTQNTDRRFVWRSLSQTADQVLTRDLGASTAIDYAAVANVRRQGGGILKLYQAGTGASPGAWTLVATFGTEDPETRISVVTFASVSARHWKLEWANGVPATPDYAECGYVGLGSAFEPSRACIVPVPWQLVDPSVGRASVDGQLSFTTRTSFAAGQLFFRAVDETDLGYFRSMRRSLGRKTPFFFSLDSSLGNQQWLMRFAGDLAVDRRPVPGRYDVSFDWQEAL